MDLIMHYFINNILLELLKFKLFLTETLDVGGVIEGVHNSKIKTQGTLCLL
jgi:hypothetical protein